MSTAAPASLLIPVSANRALLEKDARQVRCNCVQVYNIQYTTKQHELETYIKTVFITHNILLVTW